MENIYLDHAATSPMHPGVIKKMAEAMEATFGNPSSIHSFGRKSRHILDESRAFIARSIGAKENEIIFTSGGTEADNLAIIGTARANSGRGKHIITSIVEHHAVLNTCRYLEKEGFDITYLPVDESGLVSPDGLKEALRDDTILVTIMYGNNEVGTIQPVRELARLAKERGAVFHTDAVQAYGSENIDVNALGIDSMSVSAHKINGPKGIGFLYIKDGTRIIPVSYGGEQERKRRAGTENVPAIAAFAEAVRIAKESLDEKRANYQSMKEALIGSLQKAGIKFAINGNQEYALAHVLNISFEGTNVEQMLMNLDLAGIAVSSGSACTAGSIEPSHVLTAMFGKDSDRPYNSIRFSFGYTNTEEEVLRAAGAAVKIVQRLRTH
ncbi:cysteine desulfurase family protein [Peribacillus sp. SCS-37]|uniref:cysteine desulfurase family protein n=1 Tax=Paraperibacillus esterisolvens TaxID=3115296 RepID=UPI0039063823